jgi:hypothetical protein
MLILTVLSFTAGSIRNEASLILIGAVFQAVLCYCFFTIFVLSCIHRKSVQAVSVRILTEQAVTGSQGAYLFMCGPARSGETKKRFFRMPGILIRYEMNLTAKDGRYMRCLFDPDFFQTEAGFFTAPDRGAYYSPYDEFAIFDAAGFFRLSFRIPQEAGPRLLATPRGTADPFAITIRSGGMVQPRDMRFLRTDNLTDHRPYIPGDDPRRINWKLYGHLGDLFVREGEPEPPPHSRLLIIVDSQADSALYTEEDARTGLDALCEYALSLGLSCMERGVAVSAGYTGGTIRGGTVAELSGALAYPAVLPLSAQAELPEPAERQGMLILALPRLNAESSALDRFLKKNVRPADAVFLYEKEEFARSAAICAGMYDKRNGVRAVSLRAGVAP